MPGKTGIVLSAAIGLAVIGAGYWGPNLVRNAQATSGLRLEYLCDLDAERARRVLGGYSTVRVSDSLEEVLADPAVHAVAIATPAATHLPVAMAALEAGKHVLVEKPLAANYADGRKLVEAADSRGLKLMLDHTFCYTPAVRHLAEIIAGGELGTIQYLDSVRINLGLVQPDVDVLWDLAPHDLSIFDAILPPDIHVTEVAAHGSDPIGAGKACVAHLTLRLSHGGMAHVHANWLSPTKIRTMVIGGSAKTVVWDDLNPSQRLSIYDRGVDRSPAGELTEEKRARTIVSYRVGDMVAPALGEREALRAVMAEFAESITQDRRPLTDGHSGLRVLALLEAASESLRRGGVFVDVKQEERV
ncbi:Predicted dehydrogenase [Amycolatopsis xylanica]|uniref:Predicted dehydrogenase n=1 Tax=Amycolatopsis xylanica TaxID=589385 RepID=A0A1H3LAU4_9PSEU|nr:Predicted dehydrogenase [Amycolatopsis xylanica]